MNSAVREAEQRGRLEGRQEGEQKGRQEGKQEGKQEGERKVRIELIQMLQGLLQVPESIVEELSSYDDGQLIAMSEQLRGQLRNRKN